MAQTQAPTIRERWFIAPLENGDIQLGFEERGQRHAASVSAGGIAGVVTAILMSARDAHVMSGESDPPDPSNLMVPPLEPASIGLLNPQRNQVGMVMRFGRADLVLDISNLDLKGLGQALIAVSASTESSH